MKRPQKKEPYGLQVTNVVGFKVIKGDELSYCIGWNESYDEHTPYIDMLLEFAQQVLYDMQESPAKEYHKKKLLALQGDSHEQDA